jgi:hypothetical protein
MWEVVSLSYILLLIAAFMSIIGQDSKLFRSIGWLSLFGFLALFLGLFVIAGLTA